MLSLTLGQMRRSLGRLIAAGLAIALGTGFVAATFMGTAVLTQTSGASFEARYSGADLVIVNENRDASIENSVAEQVKALPEVGHVYPRLTESGVVQDGERSRYFFAWVTPEHEGLFPERVRDGRLPEQSGELALPVEIGERLKLSVGDTVTVPSPQRYSDATNVPEPMQMTIVGLTEPWSTVLSYDLHRGAIHPDDFEFLKSWEDSGDYVQDITLTVADGVSMADARAAIKEALPDSLVVRTAAQMADRELQAMMPGTLTLTTAVLVFAVLALAVASMVIANTFQVIVAQRTHTLAMLRCVGASSRQVKRTVRQEAAILGAASALLGIVGTWTLAQIVLTVARSMNPRMLLPTWIPVTWLTVLVPLAVGTYVAFAASRGAGDAATRVPALAALRPLDPPTLADKRGRMRLVVSVGLAVAGAIPIGIALLAATGDSASSETILFGVLGGIAWFTAALTSIPLWLPRTLTLLGDPLTRSGPMARLAIANTRRNPRRTAATSAALLIGVTLVATVSVGASTAKVSITGELDERYNYDLGISVQSQSLTPVVNLLDENEHVAAHAVFSPLTELTITTLDGVDVSDATPLDEHAVSGATSGMSTDSTALRTVLRSPQGLPLEPGTILLGPDLFTTTSDTTPWGTPTVLTPGDEVRVYAWPEPEYEYDDDNVTVTYPPKSEWTYITLIAQPDDGSFTKFHGALVDDADATELVWQPRPDEGMRFHEIWLKIDDLKNAKAMMGDLNDDLENLDAYASGPVQERMMIETVIDVLLMVVYALLAIAVLIAIVGVTNTLSLSVIERRRESATMRTIGLKQRQLRRSLAIEGVFISLAGATLGVVVGSFFGWLGIRMIMGDDTILSLPWLTLAIILAGAVVAGLLASWVPARMAAKTTPVEALAHE